MDRWAGWRPAPAVCRGLPGSVERVRGVQRGPGVDAECGVDGEEHLCLAGTALEEVWEAHSSVGPDPGRGAAVAGAQRHHGAVADRAVGEKYSFADDQAVARASRCGCVCLLAERVWDRRRSRRECRV